MAAIAYPAWYTLKSNLVAILQAVATEEATIDAGRNFEVHADRWRPWIENQQSTAMVNVGVETVEPGGGGSRRYKEDLVSVYVDMYALSTYQDQGGTLYPADELAAKRLDLLTAQVRSALTRLANADFGFTSGTIGTGDVQMALSLYSQEREEATGQYAPARWTLQVKLPYVPLDSDTVDMTELNVDLQQFAVKFTF